jgi:hypothetical protein
VRKRLDRKSQRHNGHYQNSFKEITHRRRLHRNRQLSSTSKETEFSKQTPHGPSLKKWFGQLMDTLARETHKSPLNRAATAKVHSLTVASGNAKNMP